MNCDVSLIISNIILIVLLIITRHFCIKFRKKYHDIVRRYNELNNIRVTQVIMDESEIDILNKGISKLLEDNSALAANQCLINKGLVGDEYGHQYCQLEVRISELEREIGLLDLTLSQSVAGRKNAEDAYVNLEAMYLNSVQERDLLQSKIDSLEEDSSVLSAFRILGM